MAATSSGNACINGVEIGLSQLKISKVPAETFIRVFRRPGGELNLTPGMYPATGRFDDPDTPSAYAATYMSDGVLTSLFEVRAVVQPPYRGRLVIRRSFHDVAKVARYAAKRELNVLPLTEENVNRINAIDVVREADYPGCRAIAKAVYHAFPDIDGIEYVSRMYPPHPCWTIFDRGAKDAGLRATSVTALSSEPEYIEALTSGNLTLAPIDP